MKKILCTAVAMMISMSAFSNEIGKTSETSATVEQALTTVKINMFVDWKFSSPYYGSNNTTVTYYNGTQWVEDERLTLIGNEITAVEGSIITINLRLSGGGFPIYLQTVGLDPDFSGIQPDIVWSYYFIPAIGQTVSFYADILDNF